MILKNIKVWLFDNYFNRNDNDFGRVYNCKDIYNKIFDK